VNEFTRSFPLEDIKFRAGGDGRTVEAYAAVFDQTVSVNDKDGHYMERVDPTAFNKTIADKGTRFSVLYNHGMTIYGTPSDSGSMPIGTPLEVRADSRGLLTVTRYNNTPLGEATLEAIKSNSLHAQSFSGSFVRSDKPKPRGGFRADVSGALPLVTRQEINLLEYGPTPFPYYPDARITGVRSAGADGLLLPLILADGDLDSIVAALRRNDATLAQARAVISEILGSNPDEDDEFLTRLTSLATRLDAPAGTATPSGAGTDEPLAKHSGRLSMSQRTREILAANHAQEATTNGNTTE
jgi:HK97 family phage prohead protease